MNNHNKKPNPIGGGFLDTKWSQRPSTEVPLDDGRLCSYQVLVKVRSGFVINFGKYKTPLR